MDKSTIHNFIDKVIGKKGLLRIPSWWMRKVLMQIADWVQEGDEANGKKIEKVKEDINQSLEILKKSLHVQKCVIVKTSESSGYIMVDGIKQEIPPNTKKVVTFVDTFKYG